MLSISHLEANHSDLIIDITRQAKHPHMFPMKSHSFVSQRSSLGEFLQRMKEGEDAETYMASVDVAGWKTLVNAMLRFVPEKLCFGSQEDALEYSRIHVSGVTLPQLTVSLRDSWTGVKQVELCLRLVDLNSGPGKREWWAVSKDEWERAKLDGKAAGWNPQEDGSYWPDEHFLMSKGYRIFYVQQCPGDMLVLSPAMYYWTRSLSPTVSVGWCICPKTISQFSACFQRDFMNRSACQESQVHIYTLAMDLLNREMDELPKDLVRFVGEKLAVRFEEEQRMVERGKLPNVGVFPKHQVRRCEKCRLELFFAYASCVECANAVCLKCARKHSHKVASCCNMFLSSRFQHFQERVSSRCDDSLSEDLFDPALNLHFTVSEKYRDALACVSPYSGSPNCMLFTTKLPAQSPPDPIAEPPVTKSPKISENSNLDQYIIPKKPRNYLVRP